MQKEEELEGKVIFFSYLTKLLLERKFRGHALYIYIPRYMCICGCCIYVDVYVCVIHTVYDNLGQVY